MIWYNIVEYTIIYYNTVEQNCIEQTRREGSWRRAVFRLRRRGRNSIHASRQGTVDSSNETRKTKVARTSKQEARVQKGASDLFCLRGRWRDAVNLREGLLLFLGFVGGHCTGSYGWDDRRRCEKHVRQTGSSARGFACSRYEILVAIILTTNMFNHPTKNRCFLSRD